MVKSLYYEQKIQH